MSIPVLVVGGLLGAIGVWCVISPAGAVALLARLASRRWMAAAAAAIRVGLGGLLILAAEGSRFPTLVGGVGLFLVVAGVLALLLGRSRLQALAAWWMVRPLWVVRLWAAATVAFGGVLIASA